MLKVLFLFFGLTSVLFIAAQKYTVIKNYGLEDGLPSSNIYKIIQDYRGFLWIATDNGIAFFDAKKFKTFNKNNGLTDNDVPYILKDNDHKIWAFPFKKEPVFFNTATERFENAVNENLKNAESYYARHPFKLSSGGFAIYNTKGQLGIYKNKNTVYDTSYSAVRGTRLIEQTNNSLLIISGQFTMLVANKKTDTLLQKIHDIAFYNNKILVTIQPNLCNNYGFAINNRSDCK
jgi:hypothetical protein